MREKISIILRELYGPEITNLDKISIDVITEGLLLEEWFEKEKWATYNQVLLEIKSLGNTLKTQELQYFMSDSDDPKNVCIDVINSIDNKTPELLRLLEKIKTF